MITDSISVENMRLSDAATIEGGISSLLLMYRAAKAISLADEYAGKTAVVVGSGNNGGDGFALATILKRQGKDVAIITVSDHFSEDSIYYRNIAINLGISEVAFEKDIAILDGYDTIVDCLLGTGFIGTPRGNYLDAIMEINNSQATVISADIPSGLNGDSGEYQYAVKATKTVTIGCIKNGLLVNSANERVGQLILALIGISPIYKENFVYTEDESELACDKNTFVKNYSVIDTSYIDSIDIV